MATLTLCPALQVGFNKLAVIKVLLAAGADVSLTDNRGNTPLHYAAGERPCSAARYNRFWRSQGW